MERVEKERSDVVLLMLLTGILGVGIALLLSGFGFVVLAVGGALRAGGWLFARQERAAAAKEAAAAGV